MGATGAMNGAVATNMMYGSMATSAIGSIGTAYSQSQAIKAQGAYQSAVAGTNAEIAGMESAQTLEAGDIAASRKDLETRSIIGTERAVAGASGTDVNTGSNALTRIGTSNAGMMDELTIRNNAARQAWGYKTQAIQDTFQGQMEKLTAASTAQQTLLTGGLGAISGPLSIYSNYLRWSRSMGGGSGTASQPYKTS